MSFRKLDAIDEPVRQFYLARGFQELADDPNHLWLPISAVRGLFSEGGHSELPQAVR